MPTVTFEPAGPGRYRVIGALQFDTVAEALETSRELFSGHKQLELDLQGVETTDSAGLALLVEWVGEAQRENRSVRFRNLPAQALALARISEVDKLLPIG